MASVCTPSRPVRPATPARGGTSGTSSVAAGSTWASTSSNSPRSPAGSAATPAAASRRSISCGVNSSATYGQIAASPACARSREKAVPSPSRISHCAA